MEQTLQKYVPPIFTTTDYPKYWTFKITFTQSDQSSQCAQLVAKDPIFLHVDSKDSDQAGWMPRLIWVFAGWKGNSVGFVMRWLIYQREMQMFRTKFRTVSDSFCRCKIPWNKGQWGQDWGEKTLFPTMIYTTQPDLVWFGLISVLRPFNTL